MGKTTYFTLKMKQKILDNVEDGISKRKKYRQCQYMETLDVRFLQYFEKYRKNLSNSY